MIAFTVPFHKKNENVSKTIKVNALSHKLYIRISRNAIEILKNKGEYCCGTSCEMRIDAYI